MNISTDNSINIVTFNSKYTKTSMATMDKVLLPMLKDKNVDLATMVEKSGYTNNAILSWFKKTIGMSARQYFKQQKQNLLKQRLEEMHNNGMSVQQIAESFGTSVRWVYGQFHIYGLKSSILSLNEKLDLHLPNMIQKGYTIPAMAKKFKCSVYKIRQWIENNVHASIVDYRHRNAVNLLHEQKKERFEEKQLLTSYFKEGKTLKEIAKLMGVSTTTVLRLKNKYAIQTESDRGYELMETFLDDMVKYGDKLKTMSRFFGLSESTIARRIKEKYGKNYLDIRLNR